LLRYNRCPTNKYGHRYEGQIYVHDEETIVCYFCGKVGHIMSKCRDLPKKGVSNTFKTNKKGPKKIRVPKDKVIPIPDVFNNKKETRIMVHEQRLLTTHDKRNVYVQMPNPCTWWNCNFWR